MPAKRACGTGRSSGSLVTFSVEIENLVRGLFALFGFLANTIRTHVAQPRAQVSVFVFTLCLQSVEKLDDRRLFGQG